ncbi:MAG TPA: hypothetical protein EYO73_00195 [Sulfurimonas sp.]|nr:hypothetical protein [Sulfurimonas sp.]
MAWMLIDFDVTYKEIMDFLEESVPMTLLCIEVDEPYYFSAIGYFHDIKMTQKIFYSYAQNTIKTKLLNDPDFTYDYLDEDQVEAVDYFKAKEA